MHFKKERVLKHRTFLPPELHFPKPNEILQAEHPYDSKVFQNPMKFYKPNMFLRFECNFPKPNEITNLTRPHESNVFFFPT